MRKVSIAACLLIIVSCNEDKTDPKADLENLMQTSREWSRLAIARNVDSTLSYWNDDALVISANQPILKGKQAIRQMVEGGFQNPSFQISWEPESGEISKDGNMGYLIENSRITVNDSTGKPFTEHYKSITIWKKQTNGSWKNVVDVMSPTSALQK